jgi:hypothetical protein
MTIHDFSARLGTGEERRLADYRGKVLLIVNVASKCGFTPQYNGLRNLYEQALRRASPVIRCRPIMCGGTARDDGGVTGLGLWLSAHPFGRRVAPAFC